MTLNITLHLKVYPWALWSLAEIFIYHIEQTKTVNPNNNKYTHKIIYWHRYVDHYSYTMETTDKPNNYTSTSKLNFTLETRRKHHYHYHKNSKIICIQYMQKTHHHSNSTVIHKTSNKAIQHKHTVCRSMVNRLLNIPLNSIDYKTELNIIKYNGYNLQIIDAL